MFCRRFIVVGILFASIATAAAQSTLTPLTFSTTSFQRRAAADLNGDGIADLLAVPFLAGQIQVFENPSIEERWPNLVLPCPLFTSQLASADIDVDGDMDILAANTTTVSLLRQSAGSYVRTDIALPGSVSTPELKIIDFDGDGDRDVVVGRHYWLSNSAGVLGGATAIVFPAGSPTSALGAVTADFDGDGDADIVLPVPNTSTIRVYLGNGGSALTAGPTSPLLHAIGSSGGAVLDRGDVDGDGDIDIIDVRSTTVNILTNDGSGSFTALTTPISLNAGSATTWTLTNFDGNAGAEIVVANFPTTSVYRFDPTSMPSVTTIASLSGFSAASIIAGDFTGDGTVDLGLSSTGTLNNFVIAAADDQNGPHLSASTGTPQAAVPGQTFATALTAHLEVGGIPIAGAPITFEVTRGTGAVSTVGPVLTDVNGDAQTTATAGTAGGALIVRARTPGVAVAGFHLLVRNYELDFQPAAGTLRCTLYTDFPNQFLVAAFDVPTTPPIALATPYGTVATSILAPLPTLYLIDGSGFFFPADPTARTNDMGIWQRVFSGLGPIVGTGFTIVTQVYIVGPEIYVSNAPVIVF